MGRYAVVPLLLTFALIQVGVALPGRATASPLIAPLQQSLQLSAAPVRLVAPADRSQWALRLAGYADAAASYFEGLLGVKAPSGELRWNPDPAAALQTSADALLEISEGTPALSFNDPFAILAEDHGVGFATGYARWLTAYAIARLYFANAEDPQAWWADGAALYMTDLMARSERSTTPILYNLESAYARAVRNRTPVPLEEGATERLAAGDAARGKSYATFRLLEALYGQNAVTNLLMLAANAPAAGGIRRTAVGNLPDDLQPSPQVLFDSWMDPAAAIDIGLSRVQVVDNGSKIRGRVTRSSDIPVWSQIEVRLVTGERVYVDIPASTESEDWEADISAAPVEVRLDPNGLLPDVNRGNNLFGFGDAANIRSFFPLDESLEIGELHFSGNVQTVGRRRVEEFSVTLANLTEEPVGLGLLVSAQWLDRPAARSQRRIFIGLPPSETRVASDFVEYPRRGTGRARIEARYWRADDPEHLTNRLLREPADLRNSYLIRRDPPQATGPQGSPEERLAAAQSIDAVAALTIPGGLPDSATPAVNGGLAEGGGAASTGATSDEVFNVRIVSPTAGSTPIDEMTFAVAVDGPPAAGVELYVNDRLVGRGSGNNVRAQFVPDEDQTVYVLRAIAIGADGRISSDTRVLTRGMTGFGASVDLVTLNVTVRRPGGGFIEDLTAEHFAIVEDNVAQEIVSFSKGEDTAVSVAILLDTSSSMIGGGIASAQAGANQLVDSLLRGNDRAMVLGFNDRLYLYSDFSNDVPALRAAIGATNPDGGTALYDAIVESLRKVNRRVGRRALVVLSDGIDVQSGFGYPDVLEYTRQSDVLVYSIGLQLMHDSTDLGDASDVVRRSVENLRALAEVTGGSAYFPLRLDELEDIYAEIAAELESQYSISYYPSNQQWNGQWRELEIRLKRGPGRVQARPGYYGVRPDERR